MNAIQVLEKSISQCAEDLALRYLNRVKNRIYAEKAKKINASGKSYSTGKLNKKQIQIERWHNALAKAIEFESKKINKENLLLNSLN